MERLITKSFKRLLDKGIHRGFITYEELTKSLGKRHFGKENIERAFLHIFDNKVCLVEKKSEYKSNKKKDSTPSDSDKSLDTDKSDDPIRMYLREMGGVELLSREGEIAIAKRIEAGKNVMTESLFQSPLTARKVFEWREKFEKNELLVREIVDIDSAYMDSESASSSGNINNLQKKELSENKKKGDKQETKDKKKSKDSTEDKSSDNAEEEYVEEDEFNVPLAAMEEEIKPQVISTIDKLCKNYSKLIKYQREQLDCSLNEKKFTRTKETGFKKIKSEIVVSAKSLQLNQFVLEELVQGHYVENKKIISLEGYLMRSAIEKKNF